jgi:protein TonB
MGIFYPTGPATGSRYSFTGSATGSSISLLSVAAAHGLALTLLLFVVPAERLAEFVQPLAVRLIELAPAGPPPQAQQSKPQPSPKVSVAPQRILAVATPTSATPDAAAAFTVPPQPASPAPTETAVPAPGHFIPPAPTFVATPATLTTARFDAAYLQNPRPVYPAISRRLGEEGKVVLRVHVDASGLATEVTIKTSSAFPRLDNAAREVVQQWRFVPARRGDEPTEAWVLVPIVFKLEG